MVKFNPQNLPDRTTRYAQAVIDGEYIVNDYVFASCLRHLEDLERPDIIFNVELAERRFLFYESFLFLNGGQFEGKPFVLHPAQEFIIGSIFGWIKLDGYRRFRRAYVEMGKGNGKSPLAGGIGLIGMIDDDEPRAEIYAAATKLEQAKILFKDATAMVEMSPDLSAVVQITGGEQKPNMYYEELSSFFRPIANADKKKIGKGKGQSGPRPHMAICDEIHEYSSKETIEMLERGFKWRRQPLLFMITNSGFDKTTICWQEHDHAVKVALGLLQDDSTFSYVCGLDDYGKKDKNGNLIGDDPLNDETCWIKANPLLGTILDMEYLRGIVREAKQQPGKLNGILRLHFCVWTSSESAWMTEEQWSPVEVPGLKPDMTKKCFGGLDLSGGKDLTSLARVWDNEDGTYDAIVDFFTPEDTIDDRMEVDRVDYRLWCKQGYIHALPGKVISYRHLAPWLAKRHAKSPFENVAYDRYRMELLKEELEAQGFDDIPLKEHGQGYQDMGIALQATEDLILNGKLRVRYNPVLRWNVACAVTTEDPSGARKFAKNKSTGRIDGIVALAMAIALAVRQDSVNLDEILKNPVKA